MSLFKPRKSPSARKEVIEDVVKDLPPGLRDEAKRILEESMWALESREKAIDYLRKRGLLK
ncbi:MAG: hypothetical protein N3E36_04075 [Sulfolobales archaeon]|nr:hypothetical protein [Sulfolobales archaeon]MCX8199191.1 hypothetical protein [Sulfolobales archaeon]MDW8170171.1 hypothetical protein [Desulfurococcaceae archaeon]